jgi:type II secretory ATPase GspE/PulE/Tfp pilus assembly ATPase PilB-like protein
MTESSLAPTRKSQYVEEYHENRRADEIVKHLIAIAISHRASDIHFDPVDQHMHVRFRMDGILQELYLGALEDDINANQGAIVSRIKILGRLDIAEKRRPQDGSFRAQIVKDGHIVKLDFRISIEETGAHIWAERLDPGAEDLFSCQTEVAGQTARSQPPA